MKRFWAILAVCALVLACMTGCMQSATKEETKEEAKTPQLPEKLKLDENGVPVLNVYDLNDERTMQMDIESYLEGVLAGEMRSDWPEEGLSGWATASQMAPPTRPAAAPTTATAPRATTSMRSARRLFRLRFLFGIWNLPLFSGVNPRAAFAKELYLI